MTDGYLVLLVSIVVLAMAGVIVASMHYGVWAKAPTFPKIEELGHAADLKGTWTFNTTEKTYLVIPHRCHDGSCKLRTWHMCVSTACLKDITVAPEVHTCHDSRCQYNVKHECHNLDCKERKA